MQDVQEQWDERYSAAEQVWSGQPNQALVEEVAGLRPGCALEVGCGEGADAIWLAQQGWDVTALDVSRVALERARQQAKRQDVDIVWLHTGLLEAPLPDEGFALVSAQYPALLRTSTGDAENALAAAVAPGGLLLFVHHNLVDHSHDHAGELDGEPGFDPADYVSPEDVAASLDGGWDVELDPRRERDARGGAGAHHHLDVVLRARRRG